jgi:hypothetical protein
LARDEDSARAVRHLDAVGIDGQQCGHGARIERAVNHFSAQFVDRVVSDKLIDLQSRAA